MKIVSIGKNPSSSPASNFKGKFVSARANGRSVPLSDKITVYDSYHTSGVVVEGYHGKDAVYVPYSWEQKSDAPKTHNERVTGYGTPFGPHSSYAPSPEVDVDVPVVIDPAMTLSESLSLYLPTAKGQLATHKSNLKYHEEGMQRELKYKQERDNDSFGEKLSSYFHGNYHSWSEERKMKQYNSHKASAQTARNGIQQSEKLVAQIEQTMTDIDVAKKKGNLLDISRRNIQNPNGELTRYLKELQDKKSPSVSLVMQKQVALPKDFMPLSTIILMSTGQSKAEVDSILDVNKSAIVKQAIKNPKLVENVQKTVSELIGKNDW